MMRYFYYLTGWLACWLATPAVAQADTGKSSPSQQHFAPMEDWQLPSFVAATSTANENTQNAAKHERTTLTTKANLSLAASQPSPASSATATTPATDANPGYASSVLASKPGRLAATVPMVKPSSNSHLPVSSFASTSRAPSNPVLPPRSASTKPGVDQPVARSSGDDADHGFGSDRNDFPGRLARLTAYWAGEGDYYTGRRLSSTGIHLHGGLCAVDPNVIPYGSVVVIPGVGQFLAADTGSAVVSREAAREAGQTLAERRALVIDIFFDHRSEGEAFDAGKPRFVPISWWTPSSTSHAAQAARSVFADENWNKIYSKQL
jgi:3D (Asp-Asp-Asp) domain-containing protein